MDTVQEIDPSEWQTCLFSSASIGLTFHPTRVMTSYTTSCWRRLRRLVALRWNETHWGAFELPAVFLFSHLCSSLYCSISCCYIHFLLIFFVVVFQGQIQNKTRVSRVCIQNNKVLNHLISSQFMEQISVSFHLFSFFFLLLNPLDSQLNWFCATESWTLQVAISCHW